MSKTPQLKAVQPARFYTCKDTIIFASTQYK
nr:MAG TPA: hypothetical protein [Caudoviricetes sp.]